MMFIVYPVEKLIGGLNLSNLSSTRNDDSSRSKDAHRNAFAFSLALARSLSFAELLALTDSHPWIACIEEELGIDALIDRLLQHAK